MTTAASVRKEQLTVDSKALTVCEYWTLISRSKREVPADSKKSKSHRLLERSEQL